MMKLCKDQLIEKLVKAKKQTDDEAKTQSFGGQVKTLLDKGYPDAAGMEKDQFLNYINPLKENFRTGSVIVIPEIFVSITKKMSLIEGDTGLDISEIYNADGTESPRKPYLIHDVENGKAMLGTSPDNCVKQFKKQGRHGLTANEGVMCITYHVETLKDHYMDLPGSQYGHSGRVPSLYLYGDRPELGWSSADDSGSEWGSASCGSR